jgi:hypothetical protein
VEIFFDAAHYSLPSVSLSVSLGQAGCHPRGTE